MAHDSKIPMLFLGLALALGCAQPVTVDAVLDDAEQAAGGAARLAGVRTAHVRAQGTWSSPAFNVPEMTYEAEYFFEFPDKAYWRITPAEGPQMSMGYDGQTAWSGWMAPAARNRGWMHEMIVEGVTESRLLFLAPARDEAEAKLSLVSAEPVGDPPAISVKYEAVAGGEWTLAFDSVAGHLIRGERASRFMDGKPMFARWERAEPKAFGEITLPSKIHYEGQREDQVLERVDETIVEIEWNPELPAELFAMPAPEIDEAAVGTKTMPPMTMVTLKHVGAYDTMSETIERLMDGVLEAGLLPMGPPCGVYHNDPKKVAADELQTTVAVPVRIEDEAPELPEGLRVEQWPETQVAFAYHRGDHAGEGEAHERLMAWTKANRKRIAGPPRAMWLHDPEITVTSDMLTEVQVPI